MKKYAIVGTGNRGILAYGMPMAADFKDCVQIVGACDTNYKRAELLGRLTNLDIPVYSDFDKMLSKTKPDVVVVTTCDCYHAEYIVKALEFGCDVISEKPMTTTDKMCADIIEAERSQGNRDVQLPLLPVLRKDQAASHGGHCRRRFQRTLRVDA